MSLPLYKLNESDATFYASAYINGEIVVLPLHVKRPDALDDYVQKLKHQENQDDLHWLDTSIVDKDANASVPVIDMLDDEGQTHLINPTYLFTTRKGARQSLKDRRKNDIAKQEAHNAAVQDALKLLVGHDDVQVSDIVALGSDMVKNPYVFLAK